MTRPPPFPWRTIPFIHRVVRRRLSADRSTASRSCLRAGCRDVILFRALRACSTVSRGLVRVLVVTWRLRLGRGSCALPRQRRGQRRGRSDGNPRGEGHPGAGPRPACRRDGGGSTRPAPVASTQRMNPGVGDQGAERVYRSEASVLTSSKRFIRRNVRRRPQE